MVTMDFDMIIIGGGVGGLVTASGLAQLGAEVCLIEKEEGNLGGDCLYFGCVPSKTLIKTARVANNMRNASDYGLPDYDPEIDFQAVMDRMWDVIEHIEEHDDPERFRDMGVDVRFGEGHFVDEHTFELNGEHLTGRRFLISTGSSPAVPPIDGIDDVDYLTNKEALRLDELPESMIVVGGGPVGLELGQTFHRLGTDVRILEALDQILPREDEEMASRIHDLLEADGLDIRTGIRANSVRPGGDEIIVNTRQGDEDMSLRADELLVATGRSPNVQDLNLEAAGIEHDEREGIPVNDRMETNQSHVYAVGDVTGLYPFTHVAEYQAGIVVGNILAGAIPFYNRTADYRVVPWCTYTEPELARVGMTEQAAVEEHGETNITVLRYPFTDQDRALIEGKNDGLVKLIYRDKLIGMDLLGAHIAGPSAGELIHEYVLAMQHGISPAGLSGTIHAYPTLSQAVKRTVDQYFGDVLFDGFPATIARKYLQWTR